MGNRTDHSGSSGTGNRLSSFNGLAITYDADGNVIEKFRQWVSDRHYYWSAESQLDSVIDSQNSGVKYEYNAFGKPVIKSRKSLGGSWSVDSYYLWDGDQLLMELDGSGNRRADYVYYPGTTDTPAAEELGATSVSSFRDHQIDAEGNVIGTLWGTSTDQKVSYDAWGMPTISGNADNRLFWKGLLWEGDLVSLYYVRNRWYDPELGRFASEDPIGHAGGENLYTFANNDPINGSDAAGLMQESCTTEWIEFGTNGGTETHAYSFLACRSVGGGGGAPTFGGVGAASDPGSGGGGGGISRASSHLPDDVGKRAVGVCRAAIGLTAASFFLESVGVGDLYNGLRSVSSLRTTAKFALTFGSIPDAIKTYTQRQLFLAEQQVAAKSVSGWGQMTAISYFGEAATGIEHTWWGYIPLPYASTVAAVHAAAHACLSPGE